MSRTVLVEVDVVSPAGAASTLRFSDRQVRPMPPTDTLRPNVKWDDRLVSPPTIRRALFDDLSSLTPGFGVGVLVLANADRGLDEYRTYAWGEARVYLWTSGDFSTATRVITGLCAQPNYAALAKRPARVTTPLFDYSAELDNPTARFGVYDGDNDGVTKFWEGDAALKGQTNPRAFGNLRHAHIPGVCVNAARQGYQVSELPCDSIEWVFDRGDDAGFGFAGDWGGGTFDTGSPAAGAFWSDNNRGLLQINGTPVGRLAFGCYGSDGPYVQTPGPLVARLLTLAQVPSGRIGSSVTGYSDATICGLYMVGGDSTREAIDLIARSGRAVCLPDRLGVYQMIPFGPPGAPVETVATDEVIDIDSDETIPGPVGEVRVGYDKIYTVYRADELAPAIRGTNEEVRLTSEHRWLAVSDTATKDRFPLTWRGLSLLTACTDANDADNLPPILLAMFGARADGAPRRAWRVTLELTEARLARSPGQTIHLNYDPAGIDDDFILLQEELFTPSRDRVVWTLWG